MRAWQVERQGEPTDVLQLVDIEPPQPGPGALTIAVEAAAVGLPDVLMCRGTYPLTPKGAFVPGQEVCGTVAAVGEGVDSAVVGQRVMAVTTFYSGEGGFAEITQAREDTVFSVPDSMPSADAAGFYIPFHTGWIGLHSRGQLQADETLVVLGAAGGSGAAAIQLGKAAGARVIAVAGGPEKGDFCRQMGADEVVDHWLTPITDGLRELVGSAGADVIYDPVGGDPAAAALRAIASGGRHLLVGFAAGSWANPDPAQVVFGNYSLVGVYTGAYSREFQDEVHAHLAQLWGTGDLFSLVTNQVPFSSLPEGVSSVANREALGKTVIVADHA